MTADNPAARVDLDALTEAERETLGKIVAAYDDEDQSLNDWHHCQGCPYQAQQPCACSGRVWLGDEMAAAVERILADRLAPLLAERDEARAERDALRERIDHWCAEWSVSFPGLAEHLRAALADPEAS